MSSTDPVLSDRLGLIHSVIVKTLSKLFEEAPFRVYAKDRDHVFIYANRATRSAHQASVVLGRTDADFFSTAFSQSTLEDERNLLTGKTPFLHINAFEQWADRRLTLVEVFKFPLRDEAGAIVGLWGISRELEDAPLPELPYPMTALSVKSTRTEDSWSKEGYFYRITSKDPSKRRSWFSNSFKRLYRWGSEIPSAAQRRKLIHPDDRASVLEDLRRVYRGDIRFYKKDFRMRASGPRGRYIWIRSCGFVIQREPSGIVHFVGAHRNITDTKDNELVSELLLNKFPGYIFAKDADGVFRYVNPSLVSDLGKNGPEDILGKRDEDFFPKEEVALFKKADRRITSGKETEVFTKEHVTAQGVTQEFYTVKVSIPGGIYGPGDRPGILGFATKTSTILEDLEHKRLLWDTLMQDESDVIFFKDQQGCYQEVNRAFERVFGVDRRQVTRTHPPRSKVLRRLGATLLNEIVDEDKYILQEGKPAYPQARERCTSVGGKTYTHLSRKLPVFDAQGKVKGILGIARDITDVQRAQKELAKIRKASHVIEKHVDSKLLPFLRRQSARGERGTIERRNLTVLFCDIRGFSAFCDALGEELDALHGFLRDYYSMVVRVAHKHGAVVDKFIGDGAMLLGGLVKGNRSPARECAGTIALAIGLCREFADMFQKWNVRRRSVLEPVRFMLELGVGIHHGPVCVGNIKGEERDQYTAIGPAVNFAQRIESRAGGEIDDSEKDRITRRLKDRDAHLTLLKEFHFRDSVLASQAVYRLLNEEEDAQKRLRPNPCLVDIKGIDGVFPVYGIANAILFPP